MLGVELEVVEKVVGTRVEMFVKEGSGCGGGGGRGGGACKLVIKQTTK